MSNEEGRALAKPPEGFEAVVERHRAKLERYAQRIVRDFDSAQDVVQEAFLKYLKEPAGVGGPRQVSAWLYRVTHNLCVDLIRKESRMRAQVERMDPAEALAPPPSRGLEAEDVRRILDQLLGLLTESQRKVVLLRLRDGKSYREISEITGMSVSNVGFHLYQGLKRLSATIKRSAGKEKR